MKKFIKIVAGFIGVIALFIIGFIVYFISFIAPQLKPMNTGQITGSLYSINSKTVNMYIYRAEKAIIAIDAGDKLEKTAEELKKTGIAPETVTYLFLTHTDRDHAGGLSLFKNAKVFISEEEEQMINGKTSRDKFGLMKNKPLGVKYELLKDGQEIKFGKDTITSILTPGHTPGSTSYLINGKLLFTGDTLLLDKYGKVKLFVHLFNLDEKAEAESIKKLAKIEGIEFILTGHSGYTKDIKTAFADWK